MFPTTCSTMIAASGERSSGPIIGMKRRKMRRNGSHTWPRNSSTALTGREYGTRPPNPKNIWLMMWARISRM